ncbi:MAG: alpha/beta hydrolase [Actinomycetota bacterium]
MAILSASVVSTRRGIDIEVRSGGAGPDLVWFHGLVGLAAEEPVLESLAERFTVHAPIWPGYGEIDNEGAIEDMLDFALLGWDIVDALGVGAEHDVDALGVGAGRPHLVGHSFGAMVAAEMACVARNDLDRLALVAPFGLWLDDHPIPDPFAVLPFQLTELLLADPANATKLVSGADLESDEGLAEFMVANARRLGTAGKVMFPIPNRRLSKRLYRLTAPTLVVMAGEDRLITEPYGDAWRDAIDGAVVTTIADAGHLANLEQPAAVADALADFLAD